MPNAASTSAIRAWAREQGLPVAGRGRLKPEVLTAWRDAHVALGSAESRSTGKAATKKLSAKKAASTTAPPQQVASKPAARAAAKRPVAKPAASKPAAVRKAPPRTGGAAVEPAQPGAGPLADTSVLVDRVAELEAQQAELEARVQKLEAANTATALHAKGRRRLRRN